MEWGERERLRSEGRPCRAGPGAPERDTGPEDRMQSQPKRGAGGNLLGGQTHPEWRLLILRHPRDALRGEAARGRRGVGSGISRFPRHRRAEARIEGAGQVQGEGEPAARGLWGRGGPCPQRAGLQSAARFPRRAPGARSLSSRGWGLGELSGTQTSIPQRARSPPHSR